MNADSQSVSSALASTFANDLAWIGTHSPVRVDFASRAIQHLGKHAREIGATHALLVSDRGIREKTDYEDRATQALADAGVAAHVYDGAEENPTTLHVERGVAAARSAEKGSSAIDLIIGLGGGSAMDCAKGINFLLTNGGAVRDYWGDADAAALAARKPLLPSILIPTTAGTGSEAQSFALISDADTHVKMACGDRRLPTEGGLRPRYALLDPALTRTVPRAVMIATTLDALTHAIETSASKRATEVSRETSRRAFTLLSKAAPQVLADASNDVARAQMLLGAHLAGVAIEQSMLGAAHACANPLTALFGVTHGIAVGVMMPHVLRFNAHERENPYTILGATDDLASIMENVVKAADVSPRLRDYGVAQDAIPLLAAAATQQWTAKFNPRDVDENALAQLYKAAF